MIKTGSKRKWIAFFFESSLKLLEEVVMKKCVVCDEILVYSASASNPKKYCSERCRQLFYASQIREENKPAFCIHCGARIDRRKHLTAKSCQQCLKTRQARKEDEALRLFFSKVEFRDTLAFKSEDSFLSEKIEEFLKRGGKVKKLPDSPDFFVDDVVRSISDSFDEIGVET
jgi:predicted nucleic acid-binding Zn ribbon protein